MTMLELALDFESETPLNHQIVQAIRWRIGTGDLCPGDPVPDVRVAANLWGVDADTVRLAYGELAADGWVDRTPGHVRVAGPWSSDILETTGDVDHWLADAISTAELRYGTSAERLADLVLQQSRALRVVVVECNRHQSTFLARQLERCLPVEAVPWSLAEADEPPHLPLIGTLFHHAEMRNRWPRRVDHMHFVALRTDPALRNRVSRLAARRKVRVAWVVERDIGTANALAADVSRLLPPQYEIHPVVDDPERVHGRLADDEIVFVSPVLWDSLSPRLRHDERVLDPQAEIGPQDVRRLWYEIRAAAG
jgi:DNA-binding transcriptional regulator YhcF (GntR family)